jgi:RNA polymerase sigma factor (sigma-70 family)
MDEWDDVVLLYHIQQGTRHAKEAFKVLYDRHAKNVYNNAFKILRSQEEAGLITQDCFMKVWNSSHKYDPTLGSFSSWILTVARNVAIDRKRQLRHQFSELEDFVDSLTTQDHPGSEKFWEKQVVLQAIRRLDPFQQKLWRLRGLGYTTWEIAAQIGKSESSTKRLMLKITDFLSQVIQDSKDKDDDSTS